MRSGQSAGSRVTPSSSPNVSTSRKRLRPLVFGGIVADGAAVGAGAHGLAVEAGGGGLGVLANALPHLGAEAVIEPGSRPLWVHWRK